MRFCLLFLFVCVITDLNAQVIPVIPLPNSYKKIDASFYLSSHTSLSSNAAASKVAAFFQKELLKHTGIPVGESASANTNSIQFKIDPAIKGYTLSMTERKINLNAGSEDLLFHGMMSMVQIIRKQVSSAQTIELPCWQIKDSPRYEWRGFMLDESRHFSGKEKVMQILDWMAYYKLNKFHWHLTDQPGWRIEIKKYPRLATVGGIGNHNDPKSPAKYYSQQEISEIINYASERFITVIPEIDMPGHATAANMAYPQFSGGGSEKYPEFTFHPAKAETYSYLSDILMEVDALFPSQMIHIGADEVSFGNAGWQGDPDVQRLMRDHKLNDLKAVEEYFVKRIGDSILSRNNKVLAWDEAAGSHLPSDKTIIFWWRQERPEQLKTAISRGYSVVLCPRLPLYFDFVQDSLHQVGRRWQGEFNRLQDVYRYSDELAPISKEHRKQILGIQGNLWTETVQTEERLDYLLFPRISALAEAAWTNENNKNFPEFQKRLGQDLPFYTAEGINFYDPFKPGSTSEQLR